MTRTARTWTIAAFVLIGAILLMLAPHPMAFGFNLSAIAGVVLMALFWVAIIGGGIWLAVNFVGMANVKKLGVKDDAVSILRQRYASGELNRAEYFQMMKDLENDL